MCTLNFICIGLGNSFIIWTAYYYRHGPRTFPRLFIKRILKAVQYSVQNNYLFITTQLHISVPYKRQWCWRAYLIVWRAYLIAVEGIPDCWRAYPIVGGHTWLLEGIPDCWRAYLIVGGHTWLFANPLNTELNTICHLLALLGAHHILHVSRIRFNTVNTAGYKSSS
jgi:hypothetical protein